MHNVASGPSVYPKAVLEKIAQGVLNFKGKEISSLELGHRSALFTEVRDELIALTKELIAVPDDYSILYLQGGGRLHFAQIPMNFLDFKSKVQFIDTGYWSHNAAEYASAYGQTEILASSEKSNYDHIPEVDTAQLDGRYLQYCSNNTIYGTQFQKLPQAPIPVVVDMSSDIFSRPINWPHVDLVMACAQKNFGPAGLSLVIIKNDFLATAHDNLPGVFSYKNVAAKNSNYNTPPIFNMCAALEMLLWIKEQGGVATLENETQARAALLYEAIDKSKVVRNIILPEHRSTMNIVFDCIDEAETNTLWAKFSQANITGIKGHKARGGFRVGNYIGQRKEAMEAVISFL